MDIANRFLPMLRHTVRGTMNHCSALALGAALLMGSYAHGLPSAHAGEPLATPPSLAGDPTPRSPQSFDLTAVPQGQHQNSRARLNAQRYQPMDSGLPISIMLYEDSEDSLALAAALEASLRKAGYLVTDDGAPLVLSFDLSGPSSPGQGRDTSVLQIQSDSGRSIDQRYRAHVDVYSTTEQSLMTGEPQPTAPPSGHGPSLRFQLYLNDQSTGKRLWEGWATSPLLPQGSRATAIALSDPLVGALGQTVRDKGVSLQAPSGQ